ncbi:MAG: DUF547 domain-containing protein [Haloferacaceae archaeon]
MSAADAEDSPSGLARSYLLAVRREESVAAAESALAGLDGDRLAASLADDAARTAFWTNVYNAAVQARLREDPRRLRGLSTVRFFRRPAVTVAGHDLSPNDIEHGLLRGSRLSVGLGYLPRPRPDAFERTHRVRDPDPRVHFALNCGAASCPAIAAYDAAALDDQLRLATDAYLDGAVAYDPRADAVTVPRLFRWFRGDFGGLAGIWRLLDAHGALPPGASAGSRLRYAPYDWSLDLGAFRADDEACE